MPEGLIFHVANPEFARRFGHGMPFDDEPQVTPIRIDCVRDLAQLRQRPGGATQLKFAASSILPCPL